MLFISEPPLSTAISSSVTDDDRTVSNAFPSKSLQVFQASRFQCIIRNVILNLYSQHLFLLNNSIPVSLINNMSSHSNPATYLVIWISFRNP